MSARSATTRSRSRSSARNERAQRLLPWPVQPDRLPTGAAQRVAAFGGQLLAWTSRLVNAKAAPADKTHREIVVQSVATGETLVFLARRAIDGTERETKLRDAIEAANREGDARFLNGAAEIFGTLSKPPFGITDEFKVK